MFSRAGFPRQVSFSLFLVISVEKCDEFFLGKEQHGQFFFLLSCQIVLLIKELFQKARPNEFKIFLH